MCSLDKSNAGNAKLFGFLEDVGMTSTQFNVSLADDYNVTSPGRIK